MKEKVIKALKIASKPAFSSINLDWMKNAKSVKFFAPHTSMIYEEESFSIYAVLQEASLVKSEVDFTFFNTLEAEYQSIKLKVDPSQIIESKTGQEFQLAAKHYLNYLSRLSKEEQKSRDDEIVNTSVQYSILSTKTGFFGFIKNKSKPTSEMKSFICQIKKLTKDRGRSSSSSSSDSDRGNIKISKNFVLKLNILTKDIFRCSY